QDTNHVFRCINRLDRDTTGVTLVAKNLLSASILAKHMEEREVSRTYVAFVEGELEEAGVIDLPIGREPESIIKRQVDLQAGKVAITHYRRLGVLKVEGQTVSVVALRLETGRTHQIRVHMAAIGHPLLGDFLYNEDNHMLSRQALHGAECRFYHPITGAYHIISAPLHEDMAALIKQQSLIEVELYDLEATLGTIVW
ncbi:MAG: RluA family pseudouridine synthase, partial [Cellulosilyticaceae bacterium]